MAVSGNTFLKIISGFGGCNSALLYSKEKPTQALPKGGMFYTDGKRFISNEQSAIRLSSRDGKSLTELYRENVGDYPKFFKMDGLSKLAFVASEMLLRGIGPLPTSLRRGGEKNGGRITDLLYEGGSIDAVVLFNRTSSIASDRKHQELIADRRNFYPSPSVFIYTLPNITSGEIAIRNGIHGETSFYILPQRDEALMDWIVAATSADKRINTILTGWLDYESPDNWEAELYISHRNLGQGV